MPTPGGLIKAGDRITDGQHVYKVVQRTSTSAPLSVWIRRVDGAKINFRARQDNMRANGFEFRLPLETGELLPPWRYYSSGEALARDLPGNLRALVGEPTPAEAAAAAADEVLGKPVKPAHHRDRENPERHGRRDKHYAPPREIQFKDAHRWVDPADAAYYREETEGLLTNKHGWTQSIIFGDDELMDFCVRGLTYLRDKAAGKLS